MSFIGDSPRVQGDSVEADILLSRPVQSLICRLKGGSLNTKQDCESQALSLGVIIIVLTNLHITVHLNVKESGRSALVELYLAFIYELFVLIRE